MSIEQSLHVKKKTYFSLLLGTLLIIHFLSMKTQVLGTQGIINKAQQYLSLGTLNPPTRVTTLSLQNNQV